MGGIHARFLLERPGFVLDVDLELPGRGVTALFGHSGSGKTTFLRCIAGLERVSKGQLIFEGETWQDAKCWRPTHQRPIGYVFQDASLFPHLTVMGNLRYGYARSRSTGRVRLDQIIDMLGIGHLLDRKPDRLSGGERQRVAIARAVAVCPRLLLMDEPLAALDLQRKREILPFLERLRDELDIPILYVSHLHEEVARLADHLVLMEGGKVLASGALSDMSARMELPVRLADDVGVVLAGVVAEKDVAWHLARVEFDGGSLWVRDGGVRVGQHVRVHVLARDVSLALQPGVTSIQNVLLSEVDAVGEDTHPGIALVRVRVGAALLLARLTRRAVSRLGIAVGQRVWTQIKSAALVE